MPREAVHKEDFMIILTYDDVLKTRSYRNLCVIIADRKENGEPVTSKIINKYTRSLLMQYGTASSKSIYKAIRHALRTAE